MEITFKIDRNDYINYYRKSIRQNIIKNCVQIALLPVVIFFYLLSKETNTLVLIGSTFIGFLAIIFISVFLPFIRTKKNFEKLLKEHPDFIGIKKIVFSDSGIELINKSNIETNKTTHFNWNTILSYYVDGKFLQILTVENKMFLIPLTPDSNYANEIGFIREKIAKNKHKESNKPLKSRPPYYLGLFCLMPFIGLIIGVTLIYLGLTKYKNQWLTIMGTCGILITLITYLVTQYNFKDDKSFDNIKQRQAQNQLTHLIKEIEFHKNQNYFYPDSLTHLNLSQYSFITDPVQEDGSTYYYQLEDDNYYLFSKGKDGTAFTEDDIHPITKDLHKIGLIK